MTDSWWLKVKRAEKHMAEIGRAAGRYAERHPYEIERIRQPASKHNIHRVKLHITEQPNSMIAVMLGDFVHNLRSALDHAIVASVPARRRNSASFQVLLEDVWAKDGRKYKVRDPKQRKAFRTATRGLSPEAMAVVKRAQPYNGAEPSHHVFAIISRLENADKHRKLIVVGAGLDDALLTTSFRGRTLRRPQVGLHQFLEDGAEIQSRLPSVIRPPLRDSEVDVQLDGTAVIQVKVTTPGGNKSPYTYRLSEIMLTCLTSTRAFLRVMDEAR